MHGLGHPLSLHILANEIIVSDHQWGHMACIMKHHFSLLCQITLAKAINVKSTLQ